VSLKVITDMYGGHLHVGAARYIPLSLLPGRFSRRLQLVNAQLPGHLRDRLPGLPDNPHRTLPEVLIELPSQLCHRRLLIGDVSTLRGEAPRTRSCVWLVVCVIVGGTMGLGSGQL
jgi:hypothetical protein